MCVIISVINTWKVSSFKLHGKEGIHFLKLHEQEVLHLVQSVTTLNDDQFKKWLTCYGDFCIRSQVYDIAYPYGVKTMNHHIIIINDDQFNNWLWRFLYTSQFYNVESLWCRDNESPYNLGESMKMM